MLLQTTLAVRIRTLGVDDKTTLTAEGNLVNVLSRLGYCA